MQSVKDFLLTRYVLLTFFYIPSGLTSLDKINIITIQKWHNNWLQSASAIISFFELLYKSSQEVLPVLKCTLHNLHCVQKMLIEAT